MPPMDLPPDLTPPPQLIQQLNKLPPDVISDGKAPSVTIDISEMLKSFYADLAKLLPPDDKQSPKW